MRSRIHAMKAVAHIASVDGEQLFEIPHIVIIFHSFYKTLLHSLVRRAVAISKL